MAKVVAMNEKEMANDEVDDAVEEIYEEDYQKPKVILEWYYIDTEGTFCILWNQFINICLYYTLLMTPMILVFPTLYSECDINRTNCKFVYPNQYTHRAIEYTLDVFYILDILFNFLKRSPTNRDLKEIAQSYLLSTFIFDAAAIVPIFLGESLDSFGFKLFRLIHVFKLIEPI